MDKVIKAFFLLLPKGFIWQNMGQKYKAMIECFLEPLSKLAKYQNDIVKEISPYTSNDSVDEWLFTFGIKSTNTKELNKKLISLYASATGGQSINYFREILKKYYPSLEVKQNIETDTIEIKGEVATLTELLMIKDFLDKITPAYIFLFYNMEVLENYGQYANCLLAECGVSECGYNNN